MEKDPRISEIFYYFEEHSNVQNNRTIGRKIGVLQEVMLRKYLETSYEIRRRMLIETLVEGLSGAKHKIEFVIYEIADELNLEVGKPQAYGGVEMTLQAVSSHNATIGLRWNDASTGSSSKCTAKLSIEDTFGAAKARDLFAAEGVLVKLRGTADSGAQLTLLDLQKVIASVESKRVGAQRFADSDKLGAGIQTIEKAKQTALVAVDLDLRINGNLKKQRDEDELAAYLSIVVVGNGVHWELKSRKVLGTYVDAGFLIKDDSIIRYCDYVKKKASLAGVPFMTFFNAYFPGLTKMTVDDFEVSNSDLTHLTGPEGPDLRCILEEHIARMASKKL